jgi:hypothetical protein
VEQLHIEQDETNFPKIARVFAKFKECQNFLIFSSSPMSASDVSEQLSIIISSCSDRVVTPINVKIDQAADDGKTLSPDEILMLIEDGLVRNLNAEAQLRRRQLSYLDEYEGTTNRFDDLTIAAVNNGGSPGETQRARDYRAGGRGGGGAWPQARPHDGNNDDYAHEGPEPRPPPQIQSVNAWIPDDGAGVHTSSASQQAYMELEETTALVDAAAAHQWEVLEDEYYNNISEQMMSN